MPFDVDVSSIVLALVVESSGFDDVDDVQHRRAEVKHENAEFQLNYIG